MNEDNSPFLTWETAMKVAYRFGRAFNSRARVWKCGDFWMVSPTTWQDELRKLR